jgi:probable LLM family oxidoreductase
MQIGIDSFAAVVSDPMTGKTLSTAKRMSNLIEEIEVADKAGIDIFGVGEHHRPEYLDSAPTMILAAAASRTSSIRLTSAVTVLSAADPVRVFQEFATLDLISGGRAEMVVGRGSFIESFPLFGFELKDYDALFEEKLGLLLEITKKTNVQWSGRYRSSLTGQGVYPRPIGTLPIWLGAGGSPESFIRAGSLGLPLMVAIIGGDFRRFRPLIDLYRKAGQLAGYAPEQLKVGIHAFGFVAGTTTKAIDLTYPGFERMASTIGKERGWSPPTRGQFEAACSPLGAYLIGDVQSVTEKVFHVNRVLGGISRLSFQMTNVMLPHADMLAGIELLGTRVAPLVREKLSEPIL